MEPLGLYIHIPFCVRKCKYCDFLSAPADEETMRAYTRALTREIRQRARQMRGELFQKYPVDTIFFGGGTPTALPADCLSSILNTAYEGFDVLPDAEITCEMNPGTFVEDAACRSEEEGRRKAKRSDLDQELLHFLTQSVNRVSIGLQSVHDRELSTLGRIHSFQDFQACFAALRRFGAKNISVDLMFGLPGQTPAGWEESLRTVAELSPEHISAYGLILEESTPFFSMEERGVFTGELSLPDEETERQMYRAAGRILSDYGFRRYEISNYAKPGFESRHNGRYWQRRPYLGFGLGAASFFDHRRWRNTRSLETYLSVLEEEPCRSFGQAGNSERQTVRKTSFEDKKATQRKKDLEKEPLSVEALEREAERLSEKAEMEEFMFLGLRMDRGISETAFARAFGKPITAVYGEVLSRLEAGGLLRPRKEDNTGCWSLTDRGLDISNRVLAEFLLT